MSRTVSSDKDNDERKHPKDSSVYWLDPEIEEGNVEYKLKVVDPNSVRFQQLVPISTFFYDDDPFQVTQMKFRLSEGNGKCYYVIGVSDDGYPRGLLSDELNQSIDGIFQMAEILQANAEIQQRFVGGYGRECAVVKVIQSLHENLESIGIRIGGSWYFYYLSSKVNIVIGATDAGKSTLIACLTNGDDDLPSLDNGQGSARTNILKHKHEIETGHTSTVTKHFLGYHSDGQVLNYSGLSTMTSAEICLAAAKRVNLIDMGGHEKFLKTVFKGLTSMSLDCVLICISALSGLTSICRQHIAIALALKFPIVFAITKMDMITEEGALKIVKAIERLLLFACSVRTDKKPSLSERLNRLFEITCQEDVETANRLLSGGDSFDCVPLIKVSSVTGLGLDLVHSLMARLRSRIGKSNKNINEQMPHFQIDEIIELTHAGNILSGTLLSGHITIGQHLKLGPDSKGCFSIVEIDSLRCNQVPVKSILAGQTATISVTDLSSSSKNTSSKRSDSEDESEETSIGTIKALRKELREAQADCDRLHCIETSTPLEGSVLLDLNTDTTMYKAIEAVVILIGGHWPPRGLLSGKWPPVEDIDDDSDNPGTELAQSQSTQTRSFSPGRQKKKQQGIYSVEIYSKGIRQAATVLSMEELKNDHLSEDILPISLREAAVVCKEDAIESIHDAQDCIARIHFEFQMHSEWIQSGTILIIRDQTQGHLSGIGFVTAVL